MLGAPVGLRNWDHCARTELTLPRHWTIAPPCPRGERRLEEGTGADSGHIRAQRSAECPVSTPLGPSKLQIGQSGRRCGKHSHSPLGSGCCPQQDMALSRCLVASWPQRAESHVPGSIPVPLAPRTRGCSPQSSVSRVLGALQSHFLAHRTQTQTGHARPERPKQQGSEDPEPWPHRPFVRQDAGEACGAGMEPH